MGKVRPALLSAVLALAAAAPAAPEPERVTVPPGQGYLGCVPGDTGCYPEERPGRAVAVGGLVVDATEVTRADFAAWAAGAGRPAPPSPPFPQGDDHPVVNVTWQDAVDYCTARGMRLPTAAEWERVARGSEPGRIFPRGSTISHDEANYLGTQGLDVWETTSPVHAFPPNDLGVYDMVGNVWEWLADAYDPTAYENPDAAAGAAGWTAAQRELRGGSYKSPPESLRVSNRGRLAPDVRAPYVGFRCVRDLERGAAQLAAASIADEQGESAGPYGSGKTPAAPSPGPSASRTSLPEGAAAGSGTVPVADAAPANASGGEGAPAALPAGGTGGGGAGTRGPAEVPVVAIPGATYSMGCTVGDGSCFADEQPRHEVVVRPFFMATTETTFAQYDGFARRTGRTPPPIPSWAGPDHPVIEVSWDDARAFCEYSGGRLPTEVEWEYAARGGSNARRYPNGGTVTHDDANFDGTGGRDVWAKTAPVGSFPANGFGLYDMAGNVWEWCGDVYEEHAYARSGEPAAAPEADGSTAGARRVVRGGSWTSDPGRLRVSYRYSLEPASRLLFTGFRCAFDH